MNLKVSIVGCCCALVFLGAGQMESSARAQGNTRHTRAIELSETNNTEVLKRLNQLGDKKDENKELGEEWSKSFGSLSVEDQASGAWAPYYGGSGGRAIPNKRVKELLERQKNWTLTPTDLISASANGDWSRSSELQTDGQDKNKSSSVRQFYDAMPDRNRAGSNSGTDDERSYRQSMLKEDLNTPEDPTLPVGVRDEAQQLRKLLMDQASTGANGYAGTETHSTPSDFFGFGSFTPTRADTEAQQTRTKDLQALYGIVSGPAASSDLRMNALTPVGGSATPITAGGLPATALPRQDNPLSTLGTPPTSVWSPGTPSFSAPLHQWNPLYTPPAPELPKVTPQQPIAAPVEFPHRRF